MATPNIQSIILLFFLTAKGLILATLILFLKDLDELAYYVYTISKFNKFFEFA